VLRFFRFCWEVENRRSGKLARSPRTATGRGGTWGMAAYPIAQEELWEPGSESYKREEICQERCKKTKGAAGSNMSSRTAWKEDGGGRG